MFRRLVFLAGATLAAGSADADTIENLYNQPYSPTCVAYCWTSQFSNSTGGFVTYDDFTLAKSALATSVAWQGFYLDSDAPTALAEPNTDYWRLEIQSDDGQLVTQFDVPNPTVTVLGLATFSGNPQTAYSFSANLPSPVSLTAGTKYWFSAASVVEGDYLPKFIWSSASATFDNINVQVQDDGLPVQKPGDRAFQIYGTTAVPEPASWAMMIVGMAAIGGAARMRRRAAVA